LEFKEKTFTVTTTDNRKITGTMADVRFLDEDTYLVLRTPGPNRNTLVNTRHITAVEE
jgi:hypothetical protein